MLGGLFILVAGMLWVVEYTDASRLIVDDPLSQVEPTKAAAEKAISDAEESRKKVVEATAKLNEIKAKSQDKLEEIDKYLKDNLEGLLKKQKDSEDGLAAQKKKIGELITALKALQKADPKPEGVDEALKQLDDEQKKVDAEIEAVGKAKSGMKDAGGEVYKAINAMAKDLPGQLKKLADLPAPDKATAEALQKTLPEQTPVLAGNIIAQKKLKTAAGSISPELKKFSDPPPVDPTGALNDSQTAIKNILANLSGWIKTLGANVAATNMDLLNMRIEMDKDLQKNAVLALKLLAQSEEKEKSLKDFAEAAKKLAAQIKDDADYNQVYTPISNELTPLGDGLEQLPARLNLIREGLAGDFTNFKADFVQLYYFTDVFNLMKLLNPQAKELRDVSALREEATAARRKVDKADLDLADAQAEVAGLQTQVRDLEEQLQQTQEKLDISGKQVTAATRRLEELQSRPDPDQRKIKAAQQRKEDVEKENTANQATLDNLQSEKVDLPGQILAAKQKLIDAQRRAREGRSQMIQLAQIESEAFATARDNESVFYATNIVTSKDPLQHVQIYAFSSRKIIYLRGRQDDLDKAKEIIALFDRPAPQARLTLWTLELNSTADSNGAKRFNEVLSLIEQHLSNTRAQIAAVLSFLRDCINEEVNSIAITKLSELEAEKQNNRLARTHLDEHPYLVPQTAQELRWARLFFFQKEVLVRLGFDPEMPAINSKNQLGVINRTWLPDPAETTTLGEALIVLSLANAASRYEIMKKFGEGIEGKLTELGLCAVCQEKGCIPAATGKSWFASTKRALGADFQPYDHYAPVTESHLRDGRTAPSEHFPPTYAYTSQQREIVNAITLAIAPRLINRLKQLQSLYAATASSVAMQSNLQSEISFILRFLWDALGLSSTDVLDPQKADAQSVTSLSEIAKNPSALAVTQRRLEEIGRRRGILRTANAQVARADMMLKQLIDAVDEDMDRHFIQPMMICLRQNLIKGKGISVGVVNRTSVLATNRLVARVDARSSAQLAIGDTQDALQAAQQLASLFLAAKTGGLLGGLNGLGGLKQRDTSEIYGLTSGSVFKVTPIFDPTGQSMRFTFDYVLANHVTDPDGSINPQLPRIERHTVNTEVELNNLELREISRFNSNSRLGIPTTYKGGIPIIKDIPGVKYVPLLGWFSRRAGKAAVIQQSLMLGQTTMYPTIADIFDLLSGDDYQPASDEKDCCKEPPGDTGKDKTGDEQRQEQNQSTPPGPVQQAPAQKPARNPDLNPRTKSRATSPSGPAATPNPNQNPDLKPRRRP